MLLFHNQSLLVITAVYIFYVREIKNADEEKKKLNSNFIYVSFIETPESRQAVLSAAASKLDELKEKEGEVQMHHIAHWLMNLKMSLKCKAAVVPPPSVKCVSNYFVALLVFSSTFIPWKSQGYYTISKLLLVLGRTLLGLEILPPG